jgi:2-polyprenyl-6-methoxyphenol hydroxylase-like FAD-dependent oxidoreductase
MTRMVIVGAGFAGLAAAKALRRADADILVIDRITTSFSPYSIRWRQQSFHQLKSHLRSADF